MNFREDMYSLLFIASVKDKYKENCEEIKETYDAKINELFKKHGIPFPRKEDEIAEKVNKEKEKANEEEEKMDKETFMAEAKK